MTFLVMDLDEIMIHSDESPQAVHPSHLSEYRFEYRTLAALRPQIKWHIHHFTIINPDELSALITIAITEHSGVIILTSNNNYDRDLLKFLADQLELSPEIKKKFIFSYFFSPALEAKYWYIEAAQTHIRNSEPSIRLSQIIRSLDYAPVLAHSNFVLLEYGITSPSTNRQIATVKVTTNTPQNKQFYTEALVKLKTQQEAENNQKRLFAETQQKQKEGIQAREEQLKNKYLYHLLPAEQKYSKLITLFSTNNEPPLLASPRTSKSPIVAKTYEEPRTASPVKQETILLRPTELIPPRSVRSQTPTLSHANVFTSQERRVIQQNPEEQYTTRKINQTPKRPAWR